MTPLRIIALIVAAFFILGGFGLSAESQNLNPWALVCFVIGVVLGGVSIPWRKQ